MTEDATLYALYTRVEGEGEPVYELVTSAPSDWSGNYVITYLNTTGMSLLKGVTPSSNGVSMENSANASTYAASGVSLDGTTLSNVANDYVFKLARHGNYYSIQSASTGAYVGMNSNSSEMYAYTAYTSTGCDWTPGAKSNVISALNSISGSYPYLSYSTQNGYFWAGSANGTTTSSIYFWRENSPQTTYYTTDPVVQVNYYTVTFLDWDGTLISEQQVAEGGSAEAPDDPVRVGYTFVEWDAEFTHVSGDITVTAVYEANPYTLHIEYVDENGDPIHETYEGTVLCDDDFEVPSPAIEGYAPDQPVIKGVMGPRGANYTVIYTKLHLIGDTDCNDKVEFNDVTLLASYLMNYSPAISEQGMINADANLDGTLDVLDLAAIYNIALGN